MNSDIGNYLRGDLFGLIGFILCIVLPFFLTWANSVLLLSSKGTSKFFKHEFLIEATTIFLGSGLSFLYMLAIEITRYDWWETLTNRQRHTPIATESLLTIAVLTGIAVGSYLLLRFFNVGKLPPLAAVTAIAGIYLGLLLVVLWCIQTTVNSINIFLILFPLNCILMGLKVIKKAVKEWQLNSTPAAPKEKPWLNTLHRWLYNSQYWLGLSFILMLPLLGMLTAVLILFGQAPDSLIRAWTQTSGWALSQQIAPPNIQYDQHYLCTVAASGHRKLVRPQRLGIRHGHSVVVNRQLCVANAFEQLLAEKLPTAHRHIRTAYDRYGYPIARKITSPFIADIIYLFMKPAEYFFLLVLYLLDTHPENRIALQYIPLPPAALTANKKYLA